MRSLSSVYKNRSFITQNERVQIPDADFQAEPAPATPNEDGENENDALKPETDAAAEEHSGASAESETPAGAEAPADAEPSPEEETAATPDAEETSSEPTVQPWQFPRMETPPPPPPPPVTRELIGEFYADELRALADDVAKQAYYDALNKKKAELRDCIAGVQTQMDELVRAQQSFIEEYTQELKFMAVDIAEKMILEKIPQDDLILERLVMQTVSTVKNADWLNVEVSERLVDLVDVLNKELDKPEYNGKAHVFPVPGTDGVCRVITNEGAIVSSIEVQADNLRRTFRELDRQNPAPEAEI